MTDKELNTEALLEEFSIMELEQRLEFEAWCDGNCSCEPTGGGDPNGGCPIVEVPEIIRPAE